jgi:hypothetical protein
MHRLDALGWPGLVRSTAGQTGVVVELSDLAAAVSRAVQHAIVQEPRRAPTVVELADALAVDRSILDAALGELDDAGLIRVRGDFSTHRSSIQLTDAGLHALDGSASPPSEPAQGS